jgi:hypothetical protein
VANAIAFVNLIFTDTVKPLSIISGMTAGIKKKKYVEKH